MGREEPQQGEFAACQLDRLAGSRESVQASRSRMRPAKRTGAFASLDGMAPLTSAASRSRMGRSHDLELRNCYTQD